MKYEPKILKNNTGKVIEFRYGGVPHIFEPGEQRPVDGEVAYHALHMTNTKLTDVTNMHDSAKPYEKVELTEEVKEEAKKMNWEDMPWRELVKAASALNIYKPGMNRKQILDELKGKPV